MTLCPPRPPYLCPCEYVGGLGLSDPCGKKSRDSPLFSTRELFCNSLHGCAQPVGGYICVLGGGGVLGSEQVFWKPTIIV